MKKTIAFILTFIIAFQVSLSVVAFKDTSANPYTNKYYTHDEKFTSATISNGFDMSYYQNSVNWTKVKADSSDFVILRAGYRGYGSAGTLVKDTKFSTYAPAARKAGLDVGVYFYSQAITTAEAVEEANYTLNIIKGYDINLPVVFDFEYAAVGLGRLYNAKLSNTQMTNICLSFCKTIESAGYTAMVYANYSMLKNDLNDDTIAKYYDIWLADYYTSPSYNGVFYDCDYTYWQYTSTGSVNGVSGGVDCNFRYVMKPKKISTISASNVSTNSITVSWSKIVGCEGYRIYDYNAETNKYTLLKDIKGANKRSFTSSGLAPGKSYTFKVRAYHIYKGEKLYGTFSPAFSFDTQLSIKAQNESQTQTTISWSAVSGTQGYEIRRSTSADGDYSVIGDAPITATSFTASGENPFATYYYKVAPYYMEDETRQYIAVSNSSSASKPSPTLSSVELKSRNSATITWKNVKGATYTQILRKVYGGKYEKVYTAKSGVEQWTNKSLPLGKKYYYIVRQVITVGSKNYYSSYTSSKNITTLKTPTMKITAKTRSVGVSWNKISGANQYAVYMKKSSTASWKRVKTLSSSTLKTTVYSLSKGKRYYFKVRALKKYSTRTVFSAASSYKSAVPK